MGWEKILLIVLASLVGWSILSAVFYRQFFKRFYDIVVSLIVLTIGLIPMVVTAICVRIFLGKNVIFKQERVGKGEKHFCIYKFRTMTDEKDKNGDLLPDSVRLTKFGKILRKTSLDELPQLFNVLKGDISLIGPRPMMPKYIPSDADIRKKRFSIRPGITGMAQINGRTNITYSERFAYDTKYAEKITLWGDIKIMFKTAWLMVKSLFRHSGNVREEDLEMLRGTLEYERQVASTSPNNAKSNMEKLESYENANDKEVAN